MRFFLTLSYLGTHYCGWQRQPGDRSVQETLEEALNTVLRVPTEVVGCGRTDTGVHARYYVAHFDCGQALPSKLLFNLNGILPQDIAVQAITPVAPDAHARYDAFERSYRYHIALRKDPFANGLAWQYPQGEKLDLQKMNAVAALLPQYAEFFPFCKTHSGVNSYACQLKSAFWENHAEAQRLVFHITANRFLRGMVRLIVGACVSVGLGKIDLEDVRGALEAQRILKKSWSVPPEGLFLTAVKYPYALGDDDTQPRR